MQISWGMILGPDLESNINRTSLHWFRTQETPQGRIYLSFDWWSRTVIGNRQALCVQYFLLVYYSTRRKKNKWGKLTPTVQCRSSTPPLATLNRYPAHFFYLPTLRIYIQKYVYKEPLETPLDADTEIQSSLSQRKSHLHTNNRNSIPFGFISYLELL